MVVPLSYFSFQPVLHNWLTMTVVCASSRFPFSLFEWSFTICLMPYNRKVLSVSLKKHSLPLPFLLLYFFPMEYYALSKFIFDLSSFQNACEPWYYHICGSVHKNIFVLLIRRSGGRGFPSLLSEWSTAMCLTQHNHQ